MDPVEPVSSPSEDTRAATKLKIPHEPKRVLIADDEHLVARGVAANLSELGYTVVGPASDGEEAIQLCRSARPDLAILDIKMPRMHGLEAGEIIFSQLGIPVIILSAYSDPEYLTDATRIGVFGYLLKPVSQDQLRTTISVAWSRFTQHHCQHDEIISLRERLEHRKLIEQAKWIIVKRKNISEPEAMKLLQRQARNNRKNLIDVARSVLEHEDMFGEE